MCRFPPRKRQHSVDSGRAIRASQASTFSSLDFVKFLLPDTGVDFRGNSPTRRISSFSFPPLKNAHFHDSFLDVSRGFGNLRQKRGCCVFARGYAIPSIVPFRIRRRLSQSVSDRRADASADSKFSADSRLRYISVLSARLSARLTAS